VVGGRLKKRLFLAVDRRNGIEIKNGADRISAIFLIH